MNPRFCWATALAALLVGGLGVASGEELLVLRNGYVIRGEVSRVGDRYVVRIGRGSETRIPLSSVEFRCRDLEDAYRLKSSRLAQGRVDQRIELIQWCLRHRLYQQAHEQLVASEQLDPLNPRVHQVRRRFDSLSNEVKPAEAPVVTNRLDSRELELLIRGLPVETIEKFTTTVQPLLVNRCSMGGCHGPTSESEFRLNRPRHGRELERPFTQRNLHATLAIINRDAPLTSPLAHAVTRRHGPNGSVNVTLSSQQSSEIIAWIKGLSKSDSVTRTVTTTASTSTLGQPKFRSTPQPKPKVGSHNRQASATGNPPTGPDPFDPDVFNRRFHSSDEQFGKFQQPAAATGPPSPPDSLDRSRSAGGR